MRTSVLRAGLLRRPAPEEAELAVRRRELAALRARLVEREHALDTLRAQLLSFEGRYIRQVGKLYAQLDEWEKKIAELDSGLVIPEGAETAPVSPSPSGEDSLIYNAEAEEPSLDLKALFRELARQIHPDYARDTADALHRTRLMAQANDAFRRLDADMLQRMLNGHDATVPLTAADELARVLTQLARMQRDIVRIDTQLQALRSSELAQLQQRVIDAALKGRDLLADMAARVKGNIGLAMRRYELDLVRKKRKEAALDVRPFLSAENSGWKGTETNAAPEHLQRRTASGARRPTQA